MQGITSMIAINKEAQVKALLRAGFSYRGISKLTNVSRATVADINSGHRATRLRARRKCPDEFTPVEAYRCPGCGGLVTTRKCIKCTIERGMYV